MALLDHGLESKLTRDDVAARIEPYQRVCFHPVDHKPCAATWRSVGVAMRQEPRGIVGRDRHEERTTYAFRRVAREELIEGDAGRVPSFSRLCAHHGYSTFQVRASVRHRFPSLLTRRHTSAHA